MNVVNIHSRELQCSSTHAFELIDSLASPHDLLWPREHWPAMRFDRPLGVGAIGGHGPIRYTVEHYDPGREIRFGFTAPKGFHGFHALRLDVADGDGPHRLTHELRMDARGVGAMQWAIVFRWLHDALVENALDRAELHATGRQVFTAWGPWVRLLRWFLGANRRGGRVSRQPTT